jgi:hypothetical protein
VTVGRPEAKRLLARGQDVAWFSEFLGEGPSGHFRRGAPGASPYVSRFMSADGGTPGH